MTCGGGKFAAMVNELFIVGGIGDALEIAAVDGFGFVVFGDGYGFETFLASGNVHVAAHEIHEIRALK